MVSEVVKAKLLHSSIFSNKTYQFAKLK